MTPTRNRTNMTRKIIAASAVAVLSLGAAACSDDDGNEDDIDNPVDGVDDQVDDELDELDEEIDGETNPDETIAD